MTIIIPITMERKELTFFLKTPIGKLIQLTCPITNTIQWLKEKIEDSEGIKPDRYYMTYGGHRLEMENTLEDYNVQKHDTIFINILMRGDQFLYKSCQLISIRLYLQINDFFYEHTDN